MPLEYVDPASQDRVYDVEKSVGLASVNLNGDVKLVQHMLQRIYAKGFATPPAKPMVVDGWIGPVTVEWIRKFQKDVNAKGHLYAKSPKWQNPAIRKCSEDGRVDAILNASSVGQVSGTIYTIVWMNSVLKKLDPQGHAGVSSVVPCKRCSYSERPNPYNESQPSAQPTVAGGY